MGMLQLTHRSSQESPNQTGKIFNSASRAVVWYVQYSNTPYSFQVMCDKEEERKEEDEQKFNFHISFSQIRQRSVELREYTL